MLAGLQEACGPPLVDCEDHLDIDTGDLRRRRTGWQDRCTKIMFLERGIIDEHGNRTEPMLTLADLVLERLRDADQEALARRNVECIPIPLPDEGPGLGWATAGDKPWNVGG